MKICRLKQRDVAKGAPKEQRQCAKITMSITRRIIRQLSPQPFPSHSLCLLTPTAAHGCGCVMRWRSRRPILRYEHGVAQSAVAAARTAERERKGGGVESNAKYSISMHSVCNWHWASLWSHLCQPITMLAAPRPASSATPAGHAHIEGGGGWRLPVARCRLQGNCSRRVRFSFPCLGASRASLTRRSCPDRSPGSISVSAPVNSNK